MTPSDLAHRLARLEQRLGDLEELQHEVHQEALSLAQAVRDEAVTTHGAAATPGVCSVPEAARRLGISVSMVHKLLRERRLGHLKVGARTLITDEHVETFLATASIEARSDAPPLIGGAA